MLKEEKMAGRAKRKCPSPLSSRSRFATANSRQVNAMTNMEKSYILTLAITTKEITVYLVRIIILNYQAQIVIWGSLRIKNCIVGLSKEYAEDAIYSFCNSHSWRSKCQILVCNMKQLWVLLHPLLLLHSHLDASPLQVSPGCAFYEVSLVRDLQ